MKPHLPTSCGAIGTWGIGDVIVGVEWRWLGSIDEIDFAVPIIGPSTRLDKNLSNFSIKYRRAIRQFYLHIQSQSHFNAMLKILSTVQSIIKLINTRAHSHI